MGVYAAFNMQDWIFDQIPYNYDTYVSLPPNSPDEASLGGVLNLEGKGRNFNYQVVIPGASKAYAERGDMGFLTYTEEGLSGTGKIENLQVNLNTITSLITRDFKGALLKTPVSGVLEYSCAGWTGNGTFHNDGENFQGTFIIMGVHTYWGGNFTLQADGKRIKMPADYIYHPQGKPEQAQEVHKIFYL